jgi:hypothetical protein
MDRVGCPIALSALVLLQVAVALRSDSIQDPPAKTPPVARETPQRPAPQLLEGVEMESTLVYEADPKTAHVLRVSCAGKDHARLWLGAGAEGSQVRLLRLRSEEHVYALRLDSPGSVELAGAQRDEALAQLELRRALLQFETLEWKGEDLTRTHALGPLGSLRARFDAAQDARPRELAFLDPQGHVQDSCRAITWDSSGPRPVPAALELWHEEARVWKETVRRVQPMSFARDAFLPRDRLAGQPPPGAWNVVQTPSPEHAARRFSLPADATWESARKELERLRREWTPRLSADGLELENRGTLELDLELRPRFVVLRLSKVPEKLPDGFEKVAGRSAVGTPLEGFEQVEPAALRALRERVPAGARTAAPYVRWALDPAGSKQVLLLLSWTTAK